jgi:hypothetical protein
VGAGDTPTGLDWRELAPPASLPIGIVTRPGADASLTAALAGDLGSPAGGG